MKSGPCDPLITKKQEGGGGFVPACTIFSAQSLWCLWVGKWHHFWQWTVGEVNWKCSQAGRVNNQSIYLDVYGSSLLIYLQQHLFGHGPHIRGYSSILESNTYFN